MKMSRFLTQAAHNEDFHHSISEHFSDKFYD